VSDLEGPQTGASKAMSDHRNGNAVSPVLFGSLKTRE
jgi:hypothetical protein